MFQKCCLYVEKSQHAMTFPPFNSVSFFAISVSDRWVALSILFFSFFISVKPLSDFIQHVLCL